MKARHFKLPAILTITALAFAGGLLAQTPTPAATSPHAGMATKAPEASGMKADCEAMMAKKQAMKDKRKAMDATLDNLVAQMNAAKESKAADALEKPTADVLNELVAQRKAMYAMKEEMDAAMMAHMMKHMQMASKTGAMQSMADCPMTKMSEHEKH
ncbi:MAG: hypothetical protein ABI584_12550 [Acidobacteriota bacterium]